ncbi:MULTISPECIES: hypothetical protein [Pacificibacter]|uniref:hypothetical protein n=1 Tax=Pacificibacter TaxID=1042323 RepID=UPI001C096B3D|nr:MULTISPECIES: hypothetical protein [Pacificibacter]MBU2937465.1 hypothetical protein [Pacificibacter marinus]MDO6615645.1 hypothetical protein [Pacificibacter sp. 1_MG-2023]
MRKSLLTFALISVTALAGCLDNDAERAIAGGLAGALVADATGGSAAVGALGGAAAGALCDDAGVCR